MTKVDDDDAGRGAAVVALEIGVRRAPAPPVMCLVRPGAGLAHLDRPCQCFFGGPPPVFLDGRATSDRRSLAQPRLSA